LKLELSTQPSKLSHWIESQWHYSVLCTATKLPKQRAMARLGNGGIFGTTTAGVPKKAPCWLVLFYQNHTTDSQGNAITESRVIVQGTKWQHGTVQSWRWKMEETYLCSHLELSSKAHSRRVNIPKLYMVCAQDIHESVLVFKEKPSLCESWSGKRHVCLVKE
jgi:hypothetical protein